jgi:D-threo-aldose 1-dehydrogenase
MRVIHFIYKNGFKLEQRPSETPLVTPVMSLPVRRLGLSKVEVTALGFGAAALGNLYRAVPDAAARATVQAALDGGIGYVDTAPHYGQGLSERRLRAVLPRQTVISTKVGRVLKPIPQPSPGTERHGFVDGDPFEPHFDYSYDGVRQSFEDSLRRLGRDRVDILLAHDLGAATHGDAAGAHLKAFLEGGYRAMIELKAEGRIGAVGLGVNEWQVCDAVLRHTDLDVILLAGRYTLLEQSPLDHFLPMCAARGVAIVAGGPYNSGVLTGGGHYDYATVPDDITRRVKALEAVCADHGVSLATAALQFPLAHPCVASVIPGMASAAEVESNLARFATDVPPALWADLKSQNLLHEAAPVPAPRIVTCAVTQ